MKHCCLTFVLFCQSFVSQVAVHHLWESHADQTLFLHCPHLVLVVRRPLLREHKMFCTEEMIKVTTMLVSIGL